jgi:hypothetical protein
VTDREALLDGVLAFEDVDVGAADGRGRDSNQGIERPDVGHGLVVEHDPAGLDKDGGSHFPHQALLSLKP